MKDKQNLPLKKVTVGALDSASVSAHPSSGIRYRSLLDLGNNKATPSPSICTSLGQPVAGRGFIEGVSLEGCLVALARQQAS